MRYYFTEEKGIARILVCVIIINVVFVVIFLATNIQSSFSSKNFNFEK
jgi:hypothetical protein